MTKKRIHLLYGILVSVSAVIAGICLIVACVDLYDFQAGSFSRESVAQAFKPIAIWVYICLALVIGGVILNLFSPADPKKLPVQKQYDTILQNLQKKVDITKCEPQLCREILQQQNRRRTHKIISFVILGICSAEFLFYALSSKNYPSDANAAVVQAMAPFFVSLLLPFGYAVFTVYHRKRSIMKEIELLKKALAGGAGADTLPAQPAGEKDTATKIVRYAILGIALAVLVGGFLFGGTADVLAKAAAICTECVGLG